MTEFSTAAPLAFFGTWLVPLPPLPASIAVMWTLSSVTPSITPEYSSRLWTPVVYRITAVCIAFVVSDWIVCPAATGTKVAGMRSPSTDGS